VTRIKSVKKRFLHLFLTNPPAWRTNRVAMAKTRYSGTCCRA